MRASPLGHALLLLSAVTALSLGIRDSPQCPRSLDCARQGRSFCRHGNTRCGPCLRPLVENSRGRCVVHKRNAHHRLETTPTIQRTEMSSFPDLDEEIDILSAVISEHRTHSLTAPPLQEVPQLMEEQPAPSGPASHISPTETATNHSGPSSAPPTVMTNHSSALLSPVVQSRPLLHDDSFFIVLSSAMVTSGSIAVVIAGALWIRLQRGTRLSQKLDSAPYGTRRTRNLSTAFAERNLVKNAQMFHYQQQRALMLGLHRQSDSPKVGDSGASSDDEDFTVYECPGLAPTHGEMEVKNPLFDDSTLYFHRTAPPAVQPRDRPTPPQSALLW